MRLWRNQAFAVFWSARTARAAVTAAELGGLLAEAVPIRLAFGLPTFSAVIGAGLAGWSCLGSRPLALPGFPVKATHVNSGNNVSRCS